MSKEQIFCRMLRCICKISQLSRLEKGAFKKKLKPNISGTILLHQKAKNYFTNFKQKNAISYGVIGVGLFFVTNSVFGQVSLTATAGTLSGSYSTIKGAFAAINNGTHQGAIAISIIGNTTETASAELYGSGYIIGSNYSAISITPSGGVARTISGAIPAGSALIYLNGADNVTINGLNTGGNSLTFNNTTQSSSTSTSTISFVNNAINNIVTNSYIYGAFNGPTYAGGAIFFGVAVLTPTTGNDNNTISNNTIGSTGAFYTTSAISSLGTSTTVKNDGILIDNNNIVDCYSDISATTGICLNENNNTWTITNNRFYQTATRLYTTSNLHNAIWIMSGEGYIISGNVIGYANAAGTGTTNMVGNSVVLPGTFPSSYTTSGTANATRFVGINCSFTAAGIVSEIQGNTIAGIALYTSSGAATTTGVLCGINVSTGNANIGTTTGNVIGSTTGNSSLYAACTTFGGTIVGINCASLDAITIKNNTVGAIDASGSTATIAGGFTGIDVTGAGSFTVEGNTIGNATVNNIRAGYFSTGGNLTNAFGSSMTTAGSATTLVGVRSSSTGAATLSNNLVSNITSACGSVYAIGVLNGTTANVFTNKIFALSSVHASGIVYGMYITGGTTNSIYNNFIGDLSSVNYTSTSAPYLGVAGLFLNQGAGKTTNAYNNTIYLGSVSSSGVNFSAFGIYASTSPTILLQNNLVTNNSTAAGSGKAIAYYRNAASLTNYASASNNNSFYGTDGLFWNGTTVYSTLANYLTTMSTIDQLSVNENPIFSSVVGSSSAYLHLPAGGITSLESGGVTIASVTTDFDGDARPGPTGSVFGGGTAYDIGADEFDGGVNAISASILSGVDSICSGSSANLQVAITGGLAPYTVVYSDGTSNFTVLTYVSGADIAVSPIANTTYTLVSVTSAIGIVGTGNIGSPIVTVNAMPTISVQPINGNLTFGAGVYSPAVAVTGGYALTYQWQFATTATGTFTNVMDNTPANAVYSNATTSALSVSGSIAVGTSYFYQCVISSTGTGCGSATSTPVQLTIQSVLSMDELEADFSKVIVSKTNILGQEINEDYKGLVIILYSNGFITKTIQ